MQLINELKIESENRKNAERELFAANQVISI